MLATIKKAIPLKIKTAIVRLSSYYKIRYAQAKRRLKKYTRSSLTPVVVATDLHSTLPNSGPVPIAQNFSYTFEVFEHIREDKVDNLIQTIRNRLHSRSIFLGIASLQSCIDVHVLVKDRAWWLQRFAQYDLVPHRDELRLIKAIGQSHPFNWTRPVAFLLGRYAND